MTKITQIINSNEYPDDVYSGAVLEINQTTDYMDEEVFYLTVENERRYAAPCAGRISALISLDREELRRLRDSLNDVLGDDATDDLDYSVDPDWLAENASADADDMPAPFNPRWARPVDALPVLTDEEVDVLTTLENVGYPLSWGTLYRLLKPANDDEINALRDAIWGLFLLDLISKSRYPAPVFSIRR